MKKNIINIVGIGPGDPKKMTIEAYETLYSSDTLIGYDKYLDMLKDTFPDKRFISTSMTKEVERCRIAFEEAEKILEDESGERYFKVSVVSSGDAGVYGMASLMYELLPEYPQIGINVIPGVTAALSGAALLGAPIANDFAVISMSDRLTPFTEIEKRLILAAKGDFGIVIYNPESKGRKGYLKKACEILAPYIEENRPVGVARNIGRAGESFLTMTFKELSVYSADMHTTVFIANSNSFFVDGKVVTRRGYVR